MMKFSGVFPEMKDAMSFWVHEFVAKGNTCSGNHGLGDVYFKKSLFWGHTFSYSMTVSAYHYTAHRLSR